MNEHNPFCPSFETTDCTRCKATGLLTTAGGREANCYTCAGTGNVLTKRGKMAREYMRGKLLVPALQVKRGDVVWFYTDHFSEGAQVTKVEHNGRVVRIYGQRAGTGQIMLAHVMDKAMVQWAHSEQELLAIRAEVEAYQAGLTKAGPPRKQLATLAA